MRSSEYNHSKVPLGLPLFGFVPWKWPKDISSFSYVSCIWAEEFAL
jgi:hypothetical protein